jgi:hypothetical protein
MNKIFRLTLVVAAALFLTFGSASATTSTINPANPAQNSPLSSAVLRANFLAAYNDINAIYAQIANIVAGYVTSFNGRTGAVTAQSGDYVVGQVTGAAPLASPTFTGTVTLPAGQVVNGVTLTTGGSTTSFLNANGVYSTISGTGTVTTFSCVTANGVSCSVANASTTPAATFTLGAITPTTVNGLTITNSTGTVTIAASKVFTDNNTLTFTGTDGSSVAFGAGGTVLYGNQSITLSGDVTGTGTTTITTTNVKTNGVAYGTNPSTNTVPVVTSSNTVTYEAVPYAALASSSANTVLGALTATTPSGLAVPSCSGATNALIWTSGTGFGCNTISGGMVYPSAGVANSTGSAWGASYAVGTAANNLVQLNGSAQLPVVSAALLTNFPTFNQNTTGSAASFTGSLSGDVTGTQGATAISPATVTGKALTGFSASAGTVSATDSILTGINKIVGNISAYVTNLSASGAGGVTGTLPVANGGTGTSTPALVAGTNVTITGTWPNNTINASGSGGSSTIGTSAAAPSPYSTLNSGTGLFTTSTNLFGVSIGSSVAVNFPSTDSTAGASLGIGMGALAAENGLTSAAYGDTAIGYSAIGSSALTSAALQDTAIGYQALSGLTSGSNDTAIGYNAGKSITTGNFNTVIGDQADSQTSQQGNTVIGYQAVATSGSGYTLVIGYQASCCNAGSASMVMGVNATAQNNSEVIVGDQAYGSGNNSTAVGAGANAQGGNATIIGEGSGSSSMSGGSNTVLGQGSGTTITSGASNIIIGQGISTVAATSSNEINVGGILFYNNGSTAAPAVTACGTSPSIDTHANNKSGTVTAGSGTATSCKITFAGSGYSTWNHCRVTPETASVAAFAYSYTKTVLTLTGTSLTSDVFDYDCDGY